MVFVGTEASSAVYSCRSRLLPILPSQSIGSSACFTTHSSGRVLTVGLTDATVVNRVSHHRFLLPSVPGSKEISSNANIPACPMLQEGDNTTSLAEAAGAVGVLFNGVSVFRCMLLRLHIWSHDGVVRED